MYYYHQKHGFTIMMLGQLFDLAIYAFVVWFVTNIAYCIDYTKLDGWVFKMNQDLEQIMNFHFFQFFLPCVGAEIARESTSKKW